MADMVERVARAIDPILWKRIDADIAGNTPFANAAKLTRVAALKTARAAIEAMREPTDAMKYAGIDQSQHDPTITGPWQAMIDAALKATT